MKKIWRNLLLISLALFPLLSFAAQGDANEQLEKMTSINVLQPSAGDLSITYLQHLFGSVGSVLHSTHGQILGQVFGIMNSGVIVIMGIILCYSLFMFVLNAAHDGDIMSRGKNTAFMVLRIVSGLSLAVPSKTTGYCIAQSIVMWVVIQGVGLADNAWNRILDYLQHEGGQVYVTNPVDSGNAAQIFLPAATDILKYEVCVQKAQILSDEDHKNQQNAKAAMGGMSSGIATSANRGIRWGSSVNAEKGYMTFGSENPDYIKGKKGTDQYLDECGRVDWSGIANDTKKHVGVDQLRYMELAVEQMVNDVRPAARQIAKAQDPDTAAIKKQTETSLIQAVNDYTNLVRPLMIRAEKDGDDNMFKEFDKARYLGWVTAGSYYRTIADANKKTSVAYKEFNLIRAGVDIKKGQLNSFSESQKDTINKTIAATNSLIGDLREDVKTLITQGKNGYEGVGSDANDKKYSASTQGLSKNDYNWMMSAVGVGGNGSAIALGPANPALASVMLVTSNSMLGTIAAWNNYLNTKTDPLVGLQNLGQTMIGIAFGLWLALAGIVTFSMALTATCSSTSGAGYGLSEGLRYVNPIIGVVLGFMFVCGTIYSIYIPLIPFLIFTFAVIGWLIAVLEAMVAAPLVALGVTHPEGHDLLGKAEQAVMLLLSIFLRPILLIVGLIAAMILAQVSMRVLNAGFSTVVGSVGINSMGKLKGANIFGSIGLIIVYTMTVIYLVNNAFNLIPLIAEKVMRWIGLHPDNAGYEGALHQIQGGLESGSKTIADTGGQQGVTAGLGSAEGYGKSQGGMKAKKTDGASSAATQSASTATGP